MSDQIRMIVRFETLEPETAVVRALRALQAKGVRFTKVLTETVDVADINSYGEISFEEAVIAAVGPLSTKPEKIVPLTPKARPAPKSAEEIRVMTEKFGGTPSTSVDRLVYDKVYRNRTWRDVINVEASLKALGKTEDEVAFGRHGDKHSDLSRLQASINRRKALANGGGLRPDADPIVVAAKKSGTAYKNGEVVKVLQEKDEETGLCYDRVYRWYNSSNTAVPYRKINVEKSLASLGLTREVLLARKWPKPSPQTSIRVAILNASQA